MALFRSGRPRRRVSLRRRIARSGALLLVLLIAPVLGIAAYIRGPFLFTIPERETVAASPERLRSDVERLCFDFAGRNHRNPEQLAASAQWIASEWTAAGLEVSFQRYEVDGVSHANVLARRRGSAGPKAGLVVLGAHHDAYLTTPGADDNASGVAALLELARVTGGTAYRLDQLFVAFDTEEPPYFGTADMGSAHVADLLLRSGERVEFMVALDMVGRFSSEPGSQTWPLPAIPLLAPDRGDFLADPAGLAGPGIVAASLAYQSVGVAPSSSPGPTIPRRLRDGKLDSNGNLPGLLITDTGPLRNFDYHGAGDRPEALDYESLAAVVAALQGLLLEVDGQR